MIYLDSNVFITALDNEEKGSAARQLLKKIQDKQETAATSALTFDEFVWVIKKQKSFEDSIQLAEAFLSLNIKIIPTTKEVLIESLEAIKLYHLKPRDAIHYASSKLNSITKFISEDNDFDKVKEINRINLLKLK